MNSIPGVVFILGDSAWYSLNPVPVVSSCQYLCRKECGLLLCDEAETKAYLTRIPSQI